MAIVDLKKTGQMSPRGKRWEVDYRDLAGRRRSKRFARRTEAEEFEASLRLDGAKEAAAKLTVDEAFDKWIEHLETHGGRSRDSASASTIVGYKSTHRKWIHPTLGPVPLARLTRDHVDAWRHTMTDDKQNPPSTQTRTRVTLQLSRLMDHCLREGLIAENPAKGRDGKLPPMPTTHAERAHVYLTSRQVWRLTAYLRGQTARNIVLTMASTAMRFGEASALTAGDFDPDTGSIEVTKAYSLANGTLTLGKTKTHESRTMRVRGDVYNMLVAAVRGKRPNDPIFVGPRGGPLRRDNFSEREFGPAARLAATAIQRLQEHLGVVEYKARTAWYGPETERAVQEWLNTNLFVGASAGGGILPEFIVGGEAPAGGPAHGREILLRPGDRDFDIPTPHDMRHTAISIAISQGANVKAVQRMAGHASATMTLDQYAGLFDEDLDAVADALASALAHP